MKIIMLPLGNLARFVKQHLHTSQPYCLLHPSFVHKASAYTASAYLLTAVSIILDSTSPVVPNSHNRNEMNSSLTTQQTVTQERVVLCLVSLQPRKHKQKRT